MVSLTILSHYQKEKVSGLLTGLFVLLIISFLLIFSMPGEASPKFLIIHLDAVSSQNFFRYMEEGDLPNLKAVFEEGHMIRHGLSLFPGGTEMAIPHLKEGIDNSEGGVGWGYYDREKGKVVSKYKAFFSLFSHIPRRAKTCFIYGIPGLDTFLFLPLLNIPELLETYGVIEFYWFTTDSLGHLMGPELYEASIRRFDRYFGSLTKRLDLDDLNIILYCDHGMSFGRFINAEQGGEVERIVGDELKILIHPNIYLKDPAKKDELARKIVLESEIDFTFYREDSHRVTGYWDEGKMIFEEKEGKIRYLYEGEDVFRYYDTGYRGEWFTDLEWLSFTKQSKYPGVPPNVYRLLANENAGDIVMVINPPKIPVNFPYPANHAGLTNTDLMMPILLRGEQLKHLYDREEMWLHNLYTSIPTLEFDDLEPSREKNVIRAWTHSYGADLSGLELSLSPAYRWNFVLRYADDAYRGWGEYDIFSSYFLRFWAGLGMHYQTEEMAPFLQTRLQMDFGKIQLNCGWQCDEEGWQENIKEIVYQINDHMAVEWFIPNGVGLSFSW